MNQSADPCTDFFDFTCGNFRPEIPNEKVAVNLFNTILDSLQKQLNETMSASIKEDEIEPFKAVKTFFKNCMETGLKENNKSIFG